MKSQTITTDHTPQLAVSSHYDSHNTGITAMIKATFTAMNKDMPYTYSGSPVSTDADIDFEKDIIAKISFPEDMKVIRHTASPWSEVMLYAGPNLAVLLEHSFGSSFSVVVNSAVSVDVARRFAKRMRNLVPEKVVEDDSVSINMWQLSTSGPSAKYKKIKAPTWQESERNYPEKVQPLLSDLMKLNKPTEDGKIILWHGEPGTGKTNAIRTLMREWKSWCTFHYVADPEKLFQFPNYLMEVGTGDHANANAWRLVIAEDTDEFLRVGAKREAGASLGRLLNFADGILGQGCNTIFLLTTNEPIGKLHSALIRPGRCLAQVEFAKFSPAEVSAWLPMGMEAPGNERSLAELYAHRNENKVIAAKSEPRRIGFAS